MFILVLENMMNYIKMEHSTKIKFETDWKKALIEEAFKRLSEIKIPIERFVIVEKHKNPICIFSPYDIEDEAGLFEQSFIEMTWQNISGQLHSFNDMPSRIFWNYGTWLGVEWHNNGEPYRKNFKFNKIIIERDEKLGEYGRYVKTNKKLSEFYLLNRNGHLHSFNDMPAFINKNGVSWYNNGNLQRMSSIETELPCMIESNGNMMFCKHKNDSPEYVKYPMSVSHYGKDLKIGLNFYEQYVDWPIRKLLTL